MIILMMQERMIWLSISRKPYAIERIISAASYLTAGLIGVIWFVVALLLRKQVTPFLMYHMMQSIFISFAFFVISLIGGLVCEILFKIPLINNLLYYVINLINMPIPLMFNLSLVQGFTTTIILYLAVTSAMGYYSYLPWVSDIIKIGRAHV